MFWRKTQSWPGFSLQQFSSLMFRKRLNWLWQQFITANINKWAGLSLASSLSVYFPHGWSSVFLKQKWQLFFRCSSSAPDSFSRKPFGSRVSAGSEGWCVLSPAALLIPSVTSSSLPHLRLMFGQSGQVFFFSFLCVLRFPAPEMCPFCNLLPPRIPMKPGKNVMKKINHTQWQTTSYSSWEAFPDLLSFPASAFCAVGKEEIFFYPVSSVSWSNN